MLFDRMLFEEVFIFSGPARLIEVVAGPCLEDVFPSFAFEALVSRREVEYVP